MMTTADKSHDEKTATREGPEKPGTLEEVDFPAVEETPTAVELEALLNKTAPPKAGQTAVGKQKDEVVVHDEKAAPTPESVDLPTHASTTTSEMPGTAYKISPEKQHLLGVQYRTVEYQII